ncbi:glutathione S-transferase family protein [Methylobacterium trifolii]|uniref:Glutathione S-transferase GST-4.5 n=1 Tax=Methylobacterium trifolii TaxID=1003092 RepID=A0ABQ4U248_9HYPH|nr:glutathione S-transferase family protein [Methylobacterium trifolii]GJE61540.1 Glutathione S-transferase GST-4.5 [Methylobacterium trifolii]
MRIFGDLTSGNCLKIKIVADHLGLAYDWVPVDALKGETRTPAYRALFPAGQIPGVEFDDGRRLAQSNAIIRYLARDSTLLPRDPFLAATVDQWLFWEQYSHEPTIAVCRADLKFRGVPRDQRDPARVARGEAALDLMERHLTGSDWFVGEAATVADVALFAYTQWAHEGGFDLMDRRAIRRWLDRCRAAFRTDSDAIAAAAGR